MPFLYWPDGVSALLLVTALVLIRQSAVEHLRLELGRLRREMRECRESTALAWVPAFRTLNDRIDASERLAARLSPARLYFVERVWRRMAGRRDGSGGSTWRSGAEAAPGPDRQLEARMRRFELEMDLKLGVFFLTASISGWAVLISASTRVLWRLRAYPARDRADRFVDFSEHLVSRLGRRAYRLALLADS
jgi:hypothetical protein